MVDFSKAATTASKSSKRRGSYWRWPMLFLLLDILFNRAVKWLASTELLKKVEHATVYYTEHAKQGQETLYTRKLVAPCNYGILTITVAPTSLRTLDIVATEYSYYTGHCFLQKLYDATHVRNYPFLARSDTNALTIPLGEFTRISSRVLPLEKKISSSISVRCGDYAVIKEGNFFDVNYYEELLETVRSWNAPSHRNYTSDGSFI